MSTFFGAGAAGFAAGADAAAVDAEAEAVAEAGAAADGVEDCAAQPASSAAIVNPDSVNKDDFIKDLHMKNR
jgi:hypothetical protein